VGRYPIVVKTQYTGGQVTHIHRCSGGIMLVPLLLFYDVVTINVVVVVAPLPKMRVSISRPLQ
jgi:hypothetical protein